MQPPDNLEARFGFHQRASSEVSKRLLIVSPKALKIAPFFFSPIAANWLGGKKGRL
jgi:hypothetical protein